MSIYIGGTTGNNEFDDYEEGSWTPVLQAYDHSSAPGGWSNVTFDESLDYTTGRYTKIGRIVQIWWYSGAFSISSGYNHLSGRFSGLPFNFVNNDPYYGGIFTFTHSTCFKDTSNNLYDCHGGYGVYGQDYFYPNIGNSTSNARWGSESTRYIMLAGCYQTGYTVHKPTTRT